MLPPPLFSQTCSENRKRELSSVPRNKLPKGSQSQFFFVFCFGIIYKLCTYIHSYISTNLLILGLGGSVGQPPLAINEKALYQPKPHPSDRTV